MDINKRLELIKRNCQEIVTEDELKELLKKKKQPSVYIGTAITGKPHVAYFLWVLKVFKELIYTTPVTVFFFFLRSGADESIIGPIC